MKIIEANFEIVTPMFISGTDNVADLRPPSIKGALRFWWRALHWGECLQKTGGKKDALILLHKQEAELFGAAANDKGNGQGILSLKLKKIETKGIERSWPVNSLQGAGYIAYGIDATKGDARNNIPSKPRRNGLSPTKFSLTLILKKSATSIQQDQLKSTLVAWGLLGGLGARARRGYGSVAITKVDETLFEFKDKKSYFQEVKKLLETTVLASKTPEFTAFSEDTKISALVGQNKQFKSLMDMLGTEYKTLRTLDKVSNSVYDRVACGLPLTGQKVRGDKFTKSRRSSPLILHVHKVGSDYIGIFSFIPAEFHPLHKQSDILPLYKVIDNQIETSNEMESIYP